MSISALKKKASSLRSIDVISFDVFDTVLFRKHGSWHSFLEKLGVKLLKEGLLADHLTPEKFVTERLSAEKISHRNAAEKGVFALPLAKIYEYFPEPYWASDVSVAELAQFEYEFEKACAFAMPEMISVIDGMVENGFRVCFISNTYYTHDQLTDLLRAIGLTERSLKHVFCSCDYGTPKQRGLFENALSAMKVSPHNVLHCGDNLSIDVTVAEAQGINTSRYLESLNGWLDETKITKSNAVSESLRRCGRFGGTDDSYIDFGFTVLGPVVAGFAKWLLNTALETGKTQMLFAEREGVFFQKAVDLLLQANLCGELDGISTRLISLSRKSVVPLAQDTGPLELRMDCYERQVRLGVSEADILVQDQVEANARQYFGRALKSPETSLFVDIGYKGTINKYLNHFLKEQGRKSLLGAYLFHSGPIDANDGLSKGYLSEHDLPAPILKRSMKGVSFLEQCFMPSLGSVVGYDGYGPLREEFVLSQAQVRQQLETQEGILTFIRELLQICQSTGFSIGEALSNVEGQREELLHLFQAPTDAVQKIAIRWKHEVNFGTNAVIPVSAAPYLDIAGSSRELINSGSGWLGVLWNYGPFSNNSKARERSEALILGTSNRGLFGPGKVQTTHPKNSPVVSSFVTAPEGEQLSVLRISDISFRSKTKDVLATILVPKFALKNEKQPSLDMLIEPDKFHRIVLVWTGKSCRIRNEEISLIKQAVVESNNLFVEFSRQLASRFVLVKLENAF